MKTYSFDLTKNQVQDLQWSLKMNIERLEKILANDQLPDDEHEEVSWEKLSLENLLEKLTKEANL